MIAIGVLKDAQDKVAAQTGVRRKVKCFFSEKDAKPYEGMGWPFTPLSFRRQSAFTGCIEPVQRGNNGEMPAVARLA
jgi:hypothetical protein